MTSSSPIVDLPRDEPGRIARDLLAELRIGLNVVDLQHERVNLPLAPAAAVRSVLDALADWFTTRRRGPANRPPPAVRPRFPSFKRAL